MKYLKTFENFDFDDEEEEEDDVVINMEKAGLKGNFLITKEQFFDILSDEDFNDAIYHTQEAIGQNDGGVASIHFSDKSDDELDEMWATENRETIIINYLKAEQDSFEF